MKANFTLFTWLLVLSSSVFSFAQSDITTLLLSNPSFEDKPRPSKVPKGWYLCGPVGESPPDIHPTGAFNVRIDAKDGDTYLGMVTRDNGTRESVGQRLKQALQANQHYQLKVFLTQSPDYSSFSRTTGAPSNYIAPTRLRVWLGNKHCVKESLAVESPLIKHTEWQEYAFDFLTEKKFTHILLEAFYTEQDSLSNGHILVDGFRIYSISGK